MEANLNTLSLNTTRWMTPEQQSLSSPDGPVMEDLVRAMLRSLGEDPNREGLKRTPERVARMYSELLAGYSTDLETLVNGAIFQAESQEMVVVRDIQFYSLCEHHLLPFFGRASVAYLPGEHIIGLSKIPRIVEMYARRLQVQERLTHQVANTLQAVLKPRGLAVLLEGMHLCQAMRGVKQSEATLVTSSMLGEFRENQALRSDFFHYLKSGERADLE